MTWRKGLFNRTPKFKVAWVYSNQFIFRQGGSFDDPPLTNQETWFVPGGTAVAMLYKFQQPDLYAYVSHNLIEAVLLGATAHVQVEGAWNNDLMQQVKAPIKTSH